MAEAALGALCRGGGWSYAAIWRSDRRDPRLLTMGECHCEDEARKVVENMLNQVHVVGEGIIGSALVSGECQWISDDISFHLVQPCNTESLGLFQGYTWWQHQFLSGIKTIAVVPIPALGVAQFGSTQKVSENLEFVDHVKGTICRRERILWDPSTKHIQGDDFSHISQFQLNSLSTKGRTGINADTENNNLLENTVSMESLGSLVSTSSNYTPSSSNGFTTYESCNIRNPTHIVAMPVNSKSINAVRVFHNASNLMQHNSGSVNPLQIQSSKQPDSTIASATTSYSSLNNLPRIEHELSCTPNKLGYRLQSEKSSSFHNSFSSCYSVVDELKPMLFDNNASRVESNLLQEVDTTGFTSQANCAVYELPNQMLEETAAGIVNTGRKGENGDTSLLDSTVFDPLLHDWWDNSVLLAGNIPHFGATTTVSVTEQLNSDPLSVEGRGLFSETVLEELLGATGPVNTDTTCGPVAASTDSLANCFSGCELPGYTLQDSYSVSKEQVPSLNFPSSSYTSENMPNGASKTIPVSLANLSMDDCCSLNTASSKVGQVTNPEGIKVIKKRVRPGESTRPRPKDRQQIQDRVKELREIVPNSAKCSIDALLDRTIKHMIFLQGVTKYAEKIKQADEPKMISKDTGAILKDNSSGVVLKDNSSTTSNGGATWAYEVAGQTMVCPIIVEDLAPPGQMLVEMLCEQRGFFLEIADTIRGFGLTILKGLMELRDGKIMARFLVEANKNVTRMDIFLSLVQLLQQNSLNRSSDQLAKVISSGVPSFVEHQQSPMLIPVGLAER
ncbi:transcription factor bHLH157 [Lolium perenne]|uniref:transcription factor bHLH157 n=1 Tax=Lolium perenne TaxID=4522 RepID=UPI0021E9EFC0|nr:transcription factor EMB1444-like [Lolium perenne]